MPHNEIDFNIFRTPIEKVTVASRIPVIGANFIDDKMLKTIENWTPDYSKVICTLNHALIKMIYSPNAPLFSFNNHSWLSLKAS